jgi:hypothetical protein
MFLILEIRTPIGTNRVTERMHKITKIGVLSEQVAFEVSMLTGASSFWSWIGSSERISPLAASTERDFSLTTGVSLISVVWYCPLPVHFPYGMYLNSSLHLL